MEDIADDACPTALWQKLPFLPDPPTPGFNPVDWSFDQYRVYAKGTLLLATAANLAFLGISVVLAIYLLLWRLAGCLVKCCKARCGFEPRLRARKSLLAYEVMHDPWLRGHKIAFCFSALGCITMAVTGLVALPRPTTMVSDLAGRLDGASAFASTLLAASDALVGTATQLRPRAAEVGALLQEELGAMQDLRLDIQCVKDLVDIGLDGPASPSVLRSQLSAVTDLLRDDVGPAVAAAVALLNATYGTAGITPALAVVAEVPTVLSLINNALAAYDDALSALPVSRYPTSGSDAAVTALRRAQGALDIQTWIFGLDTLHDSIQLVSDGASQMSYTLLASALGNIQATAAATEQPLADLTDALVGLDTLYLGSAEQQQQQTQGGPQEAGRACIGRLADRLAKFEAGMFHFASGPERGAIDGVFSVEGALERLYGIEAANGNVSALLTPLAALWEPLQQRIVPAAALDSAAIAMRCDVVQSALSYSNGSSALPNSSPTLAHLAALRAALMALVPPAADVAAALLAYDTSPSNATYATLCNKTSSARPESRYARSTAASPAPPGAAATASAAANAFTAATEAVLTSLLSEARESSFALITLLTDNSAGSWTAKYSHTSIILGELQAIKDGLYAQLLTSHTGGTSAIPSSSSTPGDISAEPPSPAPSASRMALSLFLQPLQTSVGLIDSTLSDGVKAVMDQLDNALGKDITSSSSSSLSSPSGRHRSQLLQVAPPSSAPATAAATAANDDANSTRSPTHAAVVATESTPSDAATTASNSTSTVRQQLIKRLNDVAARLRGNSSRSYTRVGYWVAIALLAAIIVSCLALAAVLYFNCPAGIVLALFVHLLLVCAVLLGAWALAAGAVVAHDSCGNADSIVLSAVSPRSPLYTLVRYYLQGVGGSLSNVLRTTGLGDTARLFAAAATLYEKVLNPLLLPAPPPNAATINATATIDATPWLGSLGTVQPVLGSVLLDVATMASNVTDNLDMLLQYGDRATVVAQYITVTSWGCCTLGGHMFMLWICATGCGLAAWLAALSAIFVLKNLDDMPVGRQCGCSCFDSKDFPRPARRRRGHSSGGGGADDTQSGNGGGRATGNGEGAETKTPYVFPPLRRMHPRQVAMATSSRAEGYRPLTSSGGASSSSGAGCSSGGAAVAVEAPTEPPRAPPNPSNIHWPTGLPECKGGSPKNAASVVVVDSGLYQGPVEAMAMSMPMVNGSTAHRNSVAEARDRPPADGGPGGGVVAAAVFPRRGSVSVCVMDPETAAAYGFDGVHGQSGGIASTSPRQSAART